MPNTKNILDIKVLGTATSGHQMAVSLINEYLDLANIAHKLEEVTDVSVFINEGLESIPAVNVNGELISLKQNGAFNKSLRHALNTILKKKNYGDLEKFVCSK